MTARVSACIIARNEEERIARCLDSLSWADEIIVVDARSTDGTVRLVREYGARVEVRAFTDYADQKNYAVSLAGGEWVLSVDADEVVSPALRDEILGAAERPDADGYRIRRRSRIFGRVFRFTGTQDDAPLRLFRKAKGRFEGAIHETFKLEGQVGTLKNFLEHYTYENVKQYLERFNRYTSAEAQKFFREGKRPRWSDLSLKPLLMFLRLYVLKQGFRDGFQGFVFSILSAYYVFVKHAKHAEALNSPKDAR